MNVGLEDFEEHLVNSFKKIYVDFDDEMSIILQQQC